MAKKYFVGVDLGGTSMRAGVVAKDGTLLAMKKRKTHPEQGAAKVVERLAEAIEGALDDALRLPERSGATAIGLPRSGGPHTAADKSSLPTLNPLARAGFPTTLESASNCRPESW